MEIVFALLIVYIAIMVLVAKVGVDLGKWIAKLIFPKNEKTENPVTEEH